MFASALLQNSRFSNEHNLAAVVPLPDLARHRSRNSKA